MSDACPNCRARTWCGFQGGFCKQCAYGMDDDLRAKYGFAPAQGIAVRMDADRETGLRRRQEPGREAMRPNEGMTTTPPFKG